MKTLAGGVRRFPRKRLFPRGVVQNALAIVMLIFAIAGATLGAPSPCRAGGNQMFEEYGVGPRDTAMGNAFTGLADNYSALYYNPAGLAFIHGNHLDIGYKGVFPEVFMKMTPDPGRNLAGGPSVDFVLLGLTTDFESADAINKRVSDRISAGLALAISQYFKSFTLFTDPNTPFMFRYRDRPVSILSLYGGFSVKVFEWASFGASVNVAPSDTYTDVIARTDITVPALQYETRQGMATVSYSKVEPVLSALFRAPLHGRPDGLGIGLTWQDEVTTLDGTGEVTTVTRVRFQQTGETYDLPKSTLDMHQLSGFSPMNVKMGLAWKPTPHIVATTDMIWKRWSAWLTGTEDRPDPPFHDTYHARFGYEHSFDIEWAWVSGVKARGGYYFEPTPAGDMNGPMNVLDNDKHVGSVGTGFSFADPTGIFLLPVQFDLAYQLHYLIEGHVNNHRDPTYGPIDFGGQVHTFAMTFTVEY